jgi:VIT1/CCC1 family predicted Fe2+/Mn2+ transporter
MPGGNGKAHAATLDAHTPEAVSARLRAVPDHRYLRDLVYGAVDGTVTTFAVVSGVAGPNLPGRIIFLGIANVVADGFSMAAGNFLVARADSQVAHRARQMEERHVDAVPVSAAMTASVFFGIGTLKSRFVNQPWYRGGLEVLGVGGGAALLAFLFGLMLRGLRPPL